MTFASYALLDPPAAADAPGFRSSLTERAQFEVNEQAGGRLRIAPIEGAGATRRYLDSWRLCDRRSSITQATWDPLRRFPRREYESTEHRALALKEIDKRAESERVEDQLSALHLAAMVLTNSEIVPFLEQQLDGLFRAFPQASLWLISVDAVLLARLSLLRIGFARSEVPDLPLGKRDEPYVRPLTEHGLTRDAAFDSAVQPVFLTFSPTATGYAVPWPPHALAVDFGGRMELRTQGTRSRGSLYEPQTLGYATGYPGLRFGDHLGPGETGSLLAWWVTRLNAVYSHSADPTRFVNDDNIHDPAAQLGWHLTVERLLADLCLLQANPQAPALARLQTAFDILDKAESLLGYGTERSGKGFERLLNRSQCRRRLRRSWERLPVGLRARFQTHGEELFESVYSEIDTHSLPHRRTGKAVKTGPISELRALPLDSYVPQLIRAVRNSSHGLVEQLSTERERLLLATHDGRLPWMLPDLVALIAYALLADFERVARGKWWE